MNINRERGACKKKIPCLKKKIRSTTFLSENLQEDVAVSLEENVLAVSFWMLQTSGKASTESTGLKELPERPFVFLLDTRAPRILLQIFLAAFSRVVHSDTADRRVTPYAGSLPLQARAMCASPLDVQSRDTSDAARKILSVRLL